MPRKSTCRITCCERCHRDYSALSKLFSEVNGISIEKYFLAQRIERVKELLAYGDLTVSEIADKLRYSSVAAPQRPVPRPDRDVAPLNSAG